MPDPTPPASSGKSTPAARAAARRPPAPPRLTPKAPPPPPAGLFATTPPAIFPPILGLIGTILALRQAGQMLALPILPPLVEALAGAILMLWAFAILALKVKVLRRPAVLLADMRPLPGRAGLATASMSGMAAGALIAPYLPTLALWLILASLLAHALLALALAAALREPAAGGGALNPTLHLSLVGVIVAAAPLVRLGQPGLAQAIFWPALAAAGLIWALSLRDLLRHSPPAPLRPLLAIHLAPAALLSLTAQALDLGALALALAALALGMALALAARAGWLLASGLSPLWSALTFPLAALSLAMQAQGALIGDLGALLALAALPLNLWIAWSVLKLWPAGKLAQMTNASTA